MALRLDYADPLAAKKVRLTSLPDGGMVIDVPPSRAPPFPLVGRLMALLATLVYTLAGVSMLNGPPALRPLAVILCLGLPVGMGFLVWSSLAPPAKRQAGVRLSAMWRDGTLTLTGPDIRYGPEEIDGRDITDVRVDFDGGMEGAAPHMRITLCRRGGTPLLLLAEQDPGDLLLVAQTLRRLLGLPSRPQRMGAWFGRMAAGFGHAATAPLPVLAPAAAPASAIPVAVQSVAQSPDGIEPSADVTVHVTAAHQAAPVTPPAVPVLAYATPGRTSGLNRGNEFKPGGMVLWFTYDATHAAFISATISRIQVVWQEGVVEFPCASMYGVYVGAASERAPLTLYVCMLDGVHGVLTAVPPDMLRNAATMLNDLLSVEGSVYSIEAKSQAPSSRF